MQIQKLKASTFEVVQSALRGGRRMEDGRTEEGRVGGWGEGGGGGVGGQRGGRGTHGSTQSGEADAPFRGPFLSVPSSTRGCS